MFLNNYYNMCKQVYTQFRSGDPSKGSSVKLTNGASSTAYGAYNDPLIFALQSISSGIIYTTLPGTSKRPGSSLTIVFGNNETPVTPDDYTTNEISNIVYQSYELSQSLNSSTLKLIFKNNSSNMITIKDILICSNCESRYSTIQVVTPAIFREVLPNPITVEAGQYFTFNLTKSYGE